MEDQLNPRTMTGALVVSQYPDVMGQAKTLDENDTNQRSLAPLHRFSHYNPIEILKNPRI